MDKDSISAQNSSSFESIPNSESFKQPSDTTESADQNSNSKGKKEEMKQESPLSFAGFILEKYSTSNQIPIPQGVKKRKNFKPTKCIVTIDDDLQYLSIDDSSCDTFVDDNGFSKSDNLNLLDVYCKDNLNKDVIQTPNSSFQNIPISMNFKQPTRRLIAGTAYQNFKLEERNKIKKKPTSSFSCNKIKEVDYTSKGNDVSILNLSSSSRDPVTNVDSEVQVTETSCGHIEITSVKPVTNLGNSTKTNASTLSSSSGISFHAPALGLASLSPASSSELPNYEKNAYHEDSYSRTSPMSYSDLPMARTTSESGFIQTRTYPIYHDESRTNDIDIPIDNENKKQCAVCGKFFTVIDI